MKTQGSPCGANTRKPHGPAPLPSLGGGTVETRVGTGHAYMVVMVRGVNILFTLNMYFAFTERR